MVTHAHIDATPPARPLDERLRRRMLITYLGLLLIIYGLSSIHGLAIDVPRSDSRGELLAVALTVTGLLLCIPKDMSGWRYPAGLVCACTAPVVAVLFHEQLIAQIWSVVPLMFIAIFIRTWHPPRTTRIIVAALAATAAAALVVAPAPVPALWLVFYMMSIVGAAEVFGLGNSALLDAAFRDPLTLAWNRAGLSRQAARILVKARRRREEVAVVVFDVDDFKGVNDQGGHAVGDLVLSDLTRRWSSQLPPSSAIGRIGGDEFVVIVGGYDERRARALADEMTRNLAVDVTTGVAAGQAARTTFDTLFVAADGELYERKRARRSA
ncbi:GGDEF domain-containing protein [Mycobacterium sp. 236(2023)]|uniref:GGDEF domain-containing protein n=1 Tax=Mycobacterium sp. 236(2023) TaxID=3038163 RepID=UPI0024153A14|nr:GGDEF domain-containing protein [Mycobacterium sp. 236(2023)]MDG4663129.1 GGDEF domain-containing protein [Mycobacterium sp. 236(2023)]